jgi:hypothetical protein
LIAHNSKETGEIIRISPRKSARGWAPNIENEKRKYLNNTLEAYVENRGIVVKNNTNFNSLLLENI